MHATTHWFRHEFDEAVQRVRTGFEAVEELLAQSQTPPFRLREAFSDMAFDMKYLLALLHFEKCHYDALVLEGRLVGTLAWLQGQPITPSWGSAFASLRSGLEAVAANPPKFENALDHSGLESPRDMFVTGPDRVTEGSREIDFDIPEAGVADQVRNEIANLAHKISARLPQAG